MIRLYGLAILIAGLFSKKAKQWISGRRGLFEKLSSGISQKKKWIWFHAASLGEFEQGRPLIELVRKEHPEYGILLTFFSPSGFLVRKDYAGADMVTYMPLDTAVNAKRFIEIVKPSIAIFIKYEIWYHHLAALESNGVPTFLISANLREDQIYFKPIGKFLGEQLRRLTHIFTQTESCVLLLKQKGFSNVSYAGDTRVDRVLAISSSPRDFAWVKKYMADGPILVAGSTWPVDEARLIPAILKSGVQGIIAPHEISEDRLKSLESQLQDAIRLSKLSQMNQGSSLSASSSPTRFVIVDTIGDLAHLYALADLSYVGGGFGKGIHNILEPAAYGIPVIIGPRHQKFAEAEALTQVGAVRSIETADEILSAIKDFISNENQVRVRSAIAVYMESQRGATERVYSSIQHLL